MFAQAGLRSPPRVADYLCLHVCMFVCMYVCMYIYIYMCVCVCVCVCVDSSARRPNHRIRWRVPIASRISEFLARSRSWHLPFALHPWGAFLHAKRDPKDACMSASAAIIPLGGSAVQRAGAGSLSSMRVRSARCSKTRLAAGRLAVRHASQTSLERLAAGEGEMSCS